MRVKTFLSWVGFIAISTFVLFPFYWGIRTSLAPRFDSNWIPHKIVLTHYASILSQYQFFLYFKNSLFVTMGSIAIVLPISLLGGYALARFSFPGAKKLGSALLVFPMLPIIAILVPLMWYMNKLGLYNKL
ncbi:carbohydrate ABC transporter permease, partial [Candidatus Aerophobetes bacterium]|nr:carbohydrate ABC transporter permease [Candidatus Aerophobetes bacterium]